MSEDAARDEERANPRSCDEGRQMEFEIRYAEGVEGERLRLEQAQVIREVVEWVARRRSESGQSSAA